MDVAKMSRGARLLPNTDKPCCNEKSRWPVIRVVIGWRIDTSLPQEKMANDAIRTVICSHDGGHHDASHRSQQKVEFFICHARNR